MKKRNVSFQYETFLCIHRICIYIYIYIYNKLRRRMILQSHIWPDWKTLHSLSERRRFSAQWWPNRGPPLNPSIRQCCDSSRGFRELFSWAHMMPRDTSLSGSYTSVRCCFSSIIYKYMYAYILGIPLIRFKRKQHLISYYNNFLLIVFLSRRYTSHIKF